MITVKVYTEFLEPSIYLYSIDYFNSNIAKHVLKHIINRSNIFTTLSCANNDMESINACKFIFEELEVPNVYYGSLGDCMMSIPFNTYKYLIDAINITHLQTFAYNIKVDTQIDKYLYNKKITKSFPYSDYCYLNTTIYDVEI